jgi:protein dithiol:quinone oxidoreductase
MNFLRHTFASPARVAGLLGLTCAGLVAGSFFVQHVLGVEPCPLCIIQRMTYLALAFAFGAAALAHGDGRLQRWLFGGALVLTLGGIGVAGYQVQLQLFPPALATTCSASLSYMLDTLSMTETLARIFNAKGDCSDTSFRILGLTLAQISLVIFTAFAVLMGLTVFRRRAAV